MASAYFRVPFLTKVIFFHWTPIDFEIEFASMHWDTPLNIKHETEIHISANFLSVSTLHWDWPRICRFGNFLQFLAISALSADLALREADYRRKSLVPRPKKVACSTSKNLRKPYICPVLRSKVRSENNPKKKAGDLVRILQRHIFLLEIKPWSIWGHMLEKMIIFTCTNLTN